MLIGSGALAAGRMTERSDAVRATSTLDVRDFGAVGDGRTKDTRALQDAIELAQLRGGRIVHLPAGTWVSGTLRLCGDLTIDLAPGAVLLGSPDPDDFAPPAKRAFESSSRIETLDFAHALLAGRELDRITIRGAGVIDMNRDRRYGPKPIALERCRFVTVQGITIVRSPNYCVSMGGCEDVLIEGVTIRDAFSDGIDPDCCRRVRIANCDIESDDDALCLKASFLLGVRVNAASDAADSRLVSIRSSVSAPMMPLRPANTRPMRVRLARAVSMTPAAVALMTAVTPPDWA